MCGLSFGAAFLSFPPNPADLDVKIEDVVGRTLTAVGD
jgi:hypothetical protein